jgi:hypothetical protein
MLHVGNGRSSELIVKNPRTMSAGFLITTKTLHYLINVILRVAFHLGVITL